MTLHLRLGAQTYAHRIQLQFVCRDSAAHRLKGAQQAVCYVLSHLLSLIGNSFATHQNTTLTTTPRQRSFPHTARPTTAPTLPPCAAPRHRRKCHGLRCPGLPFACSGCITGYIVACGAFTLTPPSLRKIPPHNLCVGKVEDQGVANKEVPRPITRLRIRPCRRSGVLTFREWCPSYPHGTSPNNAISFNLARCHARVRTHPFAFLFALLRPAPLRLARLSHNFRAASITG